MQAAAHTPGGYGGVPQSVGKEFIGKDDVLSNMAVPDEAPIAPQAGPNGRAAGILFQTPQGEILLMRRGGGGDFPYTWGLPGGHLEPGESIEDAARREALEETGFAYDGRLELLQDDGQFATYAASGVDKFEVKICDESTGFVWCSPEAAPQPLHPGLSESLRIAAAHTELDVARLMAEGILPSPQPFANMHLLAIRITGTGLAYRSSIGEHVWRDSSFYLNDTFLDRCNGLTVIRDHPDGSILDSKEFKDRAIGSVMLPYIKGDEVWGIARIYSDEVMAEICEGEVSTSPSVVFDTASQNITLHTESGEPLLIEGQGFLLDHIAIVTKERGSKGVWDKGGPATGVELTNPEEISMTTENAAKADAAGDALAQILAAVNSVVQGQANLTARMDAMEGEVLKAADKKRKDDDAKMDDDDAKMDDDDAKRKDDDSKKDDDAKKDDDKKRKDAHEGVEHGPSGEIKEDDDAKAKRKDEEAAEFADAQAHCDSVMAAFGKSASRPLDGESLMAYRKRLLRGLQSHSDSFKAVNLAAIQDAALLAVAEKQIYADALAAAKETVVHSDSLHEHVTKDRAGRHISTFTGSIGSWLDQFKIEPQRVSQFNTPGARR